MEMKTGRIEFFEDGKIPDGYVGVTKEEISAMESNPDTVVQMVTAWNGFIASRPKTTGSEKIKMRQAWVAAWIEAKK